MKTTPDTDTAGTKNDSTANGKGDLPSVIVDPAVMADGATGDTTKVEKTEEMTQPPVLEGAAANDAAAAGTTGDATAQAATAGAPTAPSAAPTASADNGADTGKDEEDKLPINDGRGLKYGLMAAAILGVIGLFGVAFVVARNSVSAPAPSISVPASGATSPGAPVPTLPEVRTPAPRLIDATGCRRGQYRVEGNQLVFTNCATLELAEPAAR